MKAQHSVSTQMVTIINIDVGLLRQKYTQNNPRVISFVSMRFHYTNLGLLQALLPWEQIVIDYYLKIIDDRLYMPLKGACNAAIAYDFDSHFFKKVQKLLTVSTQIANKIYQKIINLYPIYHSRSGFLSDLVVIISSLMDIEMFQVDLGICSLEGRVNTIRQELFSLYAMFYSILKLH